MPALAQLLDFDFAGHENFGGPSIYVNWWTFLHRAAKLPVHSQVLTGPSGLTLRVRAICPVAGGFCQVQGAPRRIPGTAVAIWRSKSPLAAVSSSFASSKQLAKD